MRAAVTELKALMLRRPRLTLAVAESMTCGRLQAKIGEISGASEFFLGGITAYTLDEKVRHLEVERAMARRVNCVSARVAGQMACGVCRLFDSDLGLATTGYAEPLPADGIDDPFAWWALACRQKGKLVLLQTGKIVCPGARRVAAQTDVADAVVAELLAHLRERRSSAGL